MTNDQWQQHLTSAVLQDKFGINQISKIIIERRLCWLGHVGCMDENWLPQIVLCEELRKKRPAHEPKKLWRDLVFADLRI